MRGLKKELAGQPEAPCGGDKAYTSTSAFSAVGSVQMKGGQRKRQNIRHVY